jgi:hypothetical protein
MPPKRSAVAAAAANDGRGSKRARRGSIAFAPDDATSDRRMDADIQRAQIASRLVEFERYHTEALWAWGADHAGWAIPKRGMQRAAVLAALSETPGVQMPTTAAQVKACWRRVMQPKKGAHFPTIAAEEERSISVDEERSSSDDEDQPSPVPAQPQNSALLAMQRTIERLEASLAAQSARVPPAAAAASNGNTNAAMCSLCLAPQLVADSTNFRCVTCGQKPHLGFAHPENEYLRELHRACSSAGSSASGVSSGQLSQAVAAAAGPQPTKRDKEYERLAAEGPPLPDYTLSASITVAEAQRTSRLSYGAAEYAPTSASLLKLVQSGRLMQVGHALPRTLAAANSHTDNADAVFVMQNGRMSAADVVSAPPLGSLRDFCSAFFGSIAPALMAQPKALAQWFALARTLVALDERHDWATAHAYLEMLLTDRVHKSASIAEYDVHIVDSAVRRRGAHSSGASFHAPTAHPQAVHGGGMTSGGIYSFARDVCRDWNLRGCSRSGCTFKHQCPWPNCTASSKNHVAAGCPAKPAGWVPPARDGSSVISFRGERGGRRGAHGPTRGGSAIGSAAALPAAASTL